MLSYNLVHVVCMVHPCIHGDVGLHTILVGASSAAGTIGNLLIAIGIHALIDDVETRLNLADRGVKCGVVNLIHLVIK